MMVRQGLYYEYIESLLENQSVKNVN